MHDEVSPRISEVVRRTKGNDIHQDRYFEHAAQYPPISKRETTIRNRQSDESRIGQLLNKLHRALKPGGKRATLEFVPEDDRVSPAMPASFALIMLAETPGKDAYTRTELENMFNRAAFSRHEFHAMPPTPHSVLVSTKA